jgi:MFS family permease
MEYESTPAHEGRLLLRRLTDSFRYQEYRRYWTGSVITQMAFQMQLVVLGWQILEATNSALWVGFVAFAYGSPLFILSPLTGVLADRGRRQLIAALALVVAALSLLALGILTATGAVQAWHIIVVAFLTGSTFTFYSPARLALLPNLIPGGMLLKASTVEYSSTRLMGFVGPILAGVLVDWLGIWPTLAVHVLPFTLAALLFIRTGRDVPQPVTESQGEGEGGGFLRSMREAVEYLRRDPPLMALVVIGLVIVPVGLTHLKLLPVFARDALGGGASLLGLLVGMSNLGGATAGFAMAALEERFDKGRAAMLSSTVLGVALVAFAFSRQPLLAVALMYLVGLLSGVFLTLSTVLFQSRAPDAVRGRLMSVWGMVWGLLPFAALLGGAVAEQWGVTMAIAGSGVICTVFCLGMSATGARLKEL